MFQKIKIHYQGVPQRIMTDMTTSMLLRAVNIFKFAKKHSRFAVKCFQFAVKHFHFALKLSQFAVRFFYFAVNFAVNFYII